jgi:hypothetical protein
VHIDQLSTNELATQLESLQEQYSKLQNLNLSLDLTRGKPGAEQVALSSALDGILDGNYLAADGTDTRNYGGLDGLTEAKTLFGAVLGLPPEETLVGGNSSLTLMYNTIDFALSEGLRGPGLRPALCHLRTPGHRNDHRAHARQRSRYGCGRGPGTAG